MPRNRNSDLVWKHNRFFGYVRMDMAHMNDIMYSETATPAAKRMASEIYDKLTVLNVQLKERVDANP